jgi:hypothetical protein
MVRFTEILKLSAGWRIRQSEFLSFQLPKFRMIFLEGQLKVLKIRLNITNSNYINSKKSFNSR